MKIEKINKTFPITLHTSRVSLAPLKSFHSFFFFLVYSLSLSLYFTFIEMRKINWNKSKVSEENLSELVERTNTQNERNEMISWHSLSHDLPSLASCFIYFECMRAKKGHKFSSAFLCEWKRERERMRQGQMVNMRPQSFSLFQICFDSSNRTMIVCMLSLLESKYHTHMANGSYVMHENFHVLVCKRENFYCYKIEKGISTKIPTRLKMWKKRRRMPAGARTTTTNLIGMWRMKHCIIKL